MKVRGVNFGEQMVQRATTVNAGDLSALVLEIFDGDGTAAGGASGGTFAGTATCDANGDTLINAGDLSCAVLLIFNGPNACTGGTAVHSEAAALLGGSSGDLFNGSNGNHSGGTTQRHP